MRHRHEAFFIGHLPSKKCQSRVNNHHAAQPRRSEPPYEVWLDQGKRIPDIAQSLTELLENGDETIDPAQVAYALGWLGDGRCVPGLIKSLESEDIYLRIEAAFALGHLKDERAIEPLCKALGRDPDSNVRANAANALGSFRGPEVINCLEAATLDKNTFVREMADSALKKMDPGKP